MPSWQVVRAEAVRQDVLDEQNASPTRPELASVSGAVAGDNGSAPRLVAARLPAT